MKKLAPFVASPPAVNICRWVHLCQLDRCRVPSCQKCIRHFLYMRAYWSMLCCPDQPLKLYRYKIITYLSFPFSNKIGSCCTLSTHNRFIHSGQHVTDSGILAHHTSKVVGGFAGLIWCFHLLNKSATWQYLHVAIGISPKIEITYVKGNNLPCGATLAQLTFPFIPHRSRPLFSSLGEPMESFQWCHGGYWRGKLPSIIQSIPYGLFSIPFR